MSQGEREREGRRGRRAGLALAGASRSGINGRPQTAKRHFRHLVGLFMTDQETFLCFSLSLSLSLSFFQRFLFHRLLTREECSQKGHKIQYGTVNILLKTQQKSEREREKVKMVHDNIDRALGSKSESKESKLGTLDRARRKKSVGNNVFGTGPEK